MQALVGITTLIIALGLTISSPAARAQELTSDEANADARWIPGVSILSSAFVQERVARQASDALPDQRGDSNVFSWIVGSNLELASPKIEAVPLQPRFFVHAGLGYAFDTQDPVVTQGDPGSPPSVPDPSASLAAVENIGSAVRAETKALILNGGLGAVFEFETWDRTFRVRPSLEWMYQRDEIRTLLGSAEIETVDPQNPTRCNPCRTLFIDEETEKGFHSLGPGLEIGTDVGRWGDILTSFYASARAYRVLGDREAELSSIGSWETSDGSPTSRADTVLRTSYKRDAWSYRFGFGLRFLWSPE